jgi:hypothetical protein
MVNGQWSMVNGQWSMVNGQWSMKLTIVKDTEFWKYGKREIGNRQQFQRRKISY